MLDQKPAVAQAKAPNEPAVAQAKAPTACVELAGTFGASPKWGSGWIDLEAPKDFAAGTKLQLTIGGKARKILVRLLGQGESPDSNKGVIPTPQNASGKRIVEVTLGKAYSRITQISVHGGPKPWGVWDLGTGNGSATLTGAMICPPAIAK
jgi:hypothetical protein